MMIFSEWIETQTTPHWADLDEATIEMIKSFFKYREICDDEKMETFFWRDLNIIAPKYKDLVRVETIDFDPLVNRYFESEYIGSRKGNGSDYGETTNNVVTDAQTAGNSTADSHSTGTTNSTSNGTTEGYANGTNTGDSTVNGTNSNVSQSTENAEGTTHSEKTIRSADKTAPMSASGAGGTSGKLNNLDFTYATSLSQTDAEEDSSEQSQSVSHTSSNGENNTVTHSTDTSVSNTGSETNNESETATDNTTNSTNVTNGTSHSNTAGTVSNNHVSNNSETNRNRNRYTGREGLTPTQAMAIASDYLMNYSTAFRWLTAQLEKNFISLYNY